MTKKLDTQLTSKDRFFEIISILKKNDILSGMNPSKFRLILEELGPTFIKIGQILSNRPDILSEEYITELAKLRNDVKPMPFLEVIDIIRQEYSTSLFQIFSKIEKKPLGSASIAQVHKAYLLDGSEVIIKVERKNIKEKMITDIKLLKKAVKTLHIQSFFKNIMSFDEALDELLAISLEEMNFLTEKDHIIEFSNVTSNINYLYTPKVYSELTTEKVIVMEYIQGTQINDQASLTAKGYDLEEIGNKLAQNYIAQVIDNGYFHADPHPDNILINEGKIIYIDYGMMGRLNNHNKEILENCIKAIINNDITEVEKNLLILGEAKKDINHSKLRSDIKMILDKFQTTNIKDINIVEFFNSILNLLGNHHITMPKYITILIRGIIVLEGTLESICPNINLSQVLEERIKNKSLKDIFNKETFLKETNNTLNSLKSLNKIPNELHRLVRDAANGEAKVNIELADSNKQIDRFEKMVHRIVVCILDVAFIVGAALIVSNGVDTSEQAFFCYIYFSVAFIFTVWLFIKMYIDKLNRK